MDGQELRSPEQLPAIEGDELVFTWDQHGEDSIVTCGEQLVWRERTGWEVYERFEEIAVVLQRRYGPRLRDLVPTPGSKWALFGDSSRGSGHVASARAQLASGAPRQYTFAELDRAVELPDIGTLRLYLLSGADPDIADPDTGATLLHRAAMRRQPSVVRLLVEFGASVSRPARDGRTALGAALEEPTATSQPARATLEIVRVLVGAGAPLGIPDLPPGAAQPVRPHKPPLALAAKNGHLEALAVLLEHGAAVDARDSGGMTALHDALLYGWTEAARQLLAAGADPGATNGPRATTPLLLAVRPLERIDQAAALVLLLVRSGAALDQADREGVTPLLAAAREGRFDLVLLLLALGADACRRDRAGQSVLHRLPWAVRHTALSPGQIVALVEALRSAGADPAARDNAGATAAEQARSWGQDRLAALLEDGARPRWLPPELPESAERFHALPAEAKKRVHEYLCAKALEAWLRYAIAAGEISYNDAVVGMFHVVDILLPVEAYALVFGGLGRVSPAFAADPLEHRYREPVVALQDDDLEFEEGVLLGYYAIYNAFLKYALGRPIDDWLIVNQAVSVFSDRHDWEILLQTALVYADAE
ncbi:MAG TPA: ankyrin repeat domain-containing protein [Roseiflexaceae bacterium]|nr:ankyrin repeat domain-containing protein [Roseiflexaceae bacterium]